MSEFLVDVAVILFVVAALFGIGFCVADSFGKFEYRTSSGQTGIAEFCELSRGQAHCRTADGKMIMVEEYKKVTE